MCQLSRLKPVSNKYNGKQAYKKMIWLSETHLVAVTRSNVIQVVHECAAIIRECMNVWE